jgi:hypothetical protein
MDHARFAPVAHQAVDLQQMGLATVLRNALNDKKRTTCFHHPGDTAAVTEPRERYVTRDLDSILHADDVLLKASPYRMQNPFRDNPNTWDPVAEYVLSKNAAHTVLNKFGESVRFEMVWMDVSRMLTPYLKRMSYLNTLAQAPERANTLMMVLCMLWRLLPYTIGEFADVFQVKCDPKSKPLLLDMQSNSVLPDIREPGKCANAEAENEKTRSDFYATTSHDMHILLTRMEQAKKRIDDCASRGEDARGALLLGLAAHERGQVTQHMGNLFATKQLVTKYNHFLHASGQKHDRDFFLKEIVEALETRPLDNRDTKFTIVLHQTIEAVRECFFKATFLRNTTTTPGNDSEAKIQATQWTFVRTLGNDIWVMFDKNRYFYNELQVTVQKPLDHFKMFMSNKMIFTYSLILTDIFTSCRPKYLTDPTEAATLKQRLALADEAFQSPGYDIHDKAMFQNKPPTHNFQYNNFTRLRPFSPIINELRDPTPAIKGLMWDQRGRASSLEAFDFSGWHRPLLPGKAAPAPRPPLQVPEATALAIQNAARVFDDASVSHHSRDRRSLSTRPQSLPVRGNMMSSRPGAPDQRRSEPQVVEDDAEGEWATVTTGRGSKTNKPNARKSAPAAAPSQFNPSMYDSMPLGRGEGEPDYGDEGGPAARGLPYTPDQRARYYERYAPRDSQRDMMETEDGRRRDKALDEDYLENFDNDSDPTLTPEHIQWMQMQQQEQQAEQKLIETQHLVNDGFTTVKRRSKHADGQY